MLIDTHAHYDHKRFDCGRYSLLEEIISSGVGKVVNPAIAFDSNYVMRKFFDDCPWLYYAVGIHPNCLGEENAEQDTKWETELRELAEDSKTVAIGETGLDYYRVQDTEMRARQRVWFHKQLEIAREIKLPVILHIRDADDEAVQILKEHPLQHSGVVHCFGGDTARAAEYMDMGLFLGIGGRITYPQEEAVRNAVRQIPMEAILLETDSPYVKPKEAPGSRNTSLNLMDVVKAISDLKQLTYEEVITITTGNAERLFNFQD